MMRSRFLRIRIFCSLSVVTVCAGCITSSSDLSTNAENYVDLSGPAAGKAQLRAAKWDIGIAGIYCYMTAPAKAERVTVSAGPVDVSVVCETADIGSSDGATVTTASFSFDALAGHDYVITKRTCGGCVKLTDETTGEVVAEFPAFSYSKSGFEQDLSTGDDIATIEGEYIRSRCRFPNGDVSSLVDVKSLVVDAGPINIDVTCKLIKLIPGSNRVTSSFTFDAEAGHTYIMNIPYGEKCIGLYDNTLKSTPIACEPYEKVH